jgi:hypothetical protein
MSRVDRYIAWNDTSHFENGFEPSWVCRGPASSLPCSPRCELARAETGSEPTCMLKSSTQTLTQRGHRRQRYKRQGWLPELPPRASMTPAPTNCRKLPRQYVWGRKSILIKRLMSVEEYDGPNVSRPKLCRKRYSLAIIKSPLAQLSGIVLCIELIARAQKTMHLNLGHRGIKGSWR